MTSLPNTVVGFKVLPISYPSSSTHILYARSHTAATKKETLLPDGRTLFLVNVPPDATERELILLFKKCGTIERIIFDSDFREQEDECSGSESDEEVQQQPRKKRKISKDDGPPNVTPLPTRPLRTLRKTGRSVHIIFLDSSSVDRVLALPNEPQPWPTSEEKEEAPSGLDHYLALYDTMRPPLDTIREHAASFVELYDHNLAKSKQQSKYRKGEAVVDDDGFTLVTRGGAYGQTLGGGVRVATKRFQQTGKTQRNRTKKKKKERPEKNAFYAFQKAERQRKEIIELKKNWERDKARVEKLKQSRTFRPY